MMGIVTIIVVVTSWVIAVVVVDVAIIVLVTSAKVVELVILPGSMIPWVVIEKLLFPVTLELQQTTMVTGELVLPCIEDAELLLEEAEASAEVLATLAMEFACTSTLSCRESSASITDQRVSRNARTAKMKAMTGYPECCIFFWFPSIFQVGDNDGTFCFVELLFQYQ